MVQVIAYDLREPNDTTEDYERVIGAIKEKFPTWCHLEKSVWLVDTSLAVSSVRNFMKTRLNDDDRVFVACLSGDWASFCLPTNQVDWLNNRSFECVT
jgi:hypothetical protein